MRAGPFATSAVLIALGACGDGDLEGREARMLVAAVEEIDVRLPVADRRERVEHLKRLRLQTEAVRSAREACLTFHESLLDAEDGAEWVRAAVAQLPDGAAPSAETARIAKRLSASNSAADRAERMQPRCEEAVRVLARRHDVRR